MNNKQQFEPLFEPFNLGNLNLKNRIVMAPMTRNASPNGIPGQNVRDYYTRRAENNVSLIITEGTFINHPDVASEVPAWQHDVPHMYGELALKGWADVVNSVHNAGGKIFSQLWHMGGRGNVDDYTTQEINGLIDAYVEGALNAQKVGFDGIELLAGHGFLIDQFFWERTNHRTDNYGGSLAKRSTFASELVGSIRRAVGPNFPISFRISQWKYNFYQEKLANNPEELETFIKPISEAGVDIFHGSTRRFWEAEFKNSELNLSGWIKKVTGKPTITIGSISLEGSDFINYFDEGREAEHNTNKMTGLVHKLENGEFDLVAVGRAILADPEWTMKIKKGKVNELKSFTKDAQEKLY